MQRSVGGGGVCYGFEGGHIVSSAALKEGEAFLLPEMLVCVNFFV